MLQVLQEGSTLEAAVFVASLALVIVFLFLLASQRPRSFMIDIDPDGRRIKIKKMRERLDGEQIFYDERGRAYTIKIRGLPASITDSIRVNKELLSDYALSRIFRGLKHGQTVRTQAFGFMIVGLIIGTLVGAMMIYLVVVSDLNNKLLETTAEMEHYKANYLNCIKQGMKTDTNTSSVDGVEGDGRGDA